MRRARSARYALAVNFDPMSWMRRPDRAAAALGVVLAVLALYAAWREARAREASTEEIPVADRLADVVASLPPDRRIAFVDLGGPQDGRRRARIELRLSLAPRVLVDEGAPAPSFVTWTDDPSTVAARAAAHGYAVVRTLPDGYVLLRRDPR